MCVALYRRIGEMHRLVVDGMRIVVELVADDDVISCIKNVVVVVVVRDGVENGLGRGVAQDVVHFRGEVGPPRRCTCRRTRRRSVPYENDEGQGGRHHRSRRLRVSVTRMRLRTNPTKIFESTN